MKQAKAGPNILITGAPACGKTTLVEGIAQSLAPIRPDGFVTREVREKGERRGFEMVSFCGKTGILADISIRSGWRVGKYGVDVAAFDAFLEELHFDESPFVIIDEIGKMECLSSLFCMRILDLLDSFPVLLATIALRGTPFIESLKCRDDVEVFCMDSHTRDQVTKHVIQRLRSALD